MRHFRSKGQKMSKIKKKCQLTEYIDIALSDLVYLVIKYTASEVVVHMHSCNLRSNKCVFHY